MKQRWKIAKIALIALASLLGLLVLALALAANFNWNRAKPWLAERVMQATERTFAINGDLSLNWQRPQQEQSGWRRWVPWPHFRAKDVVLGNPEWAVTGPTMAQVQQVDFDINPLALLQKNISVQSLILTEPRLMLEQNRKGQNNWTFAKQEEKPPSAWKLDLQDLAITQGTIRYIDQVKRADVTVRIDTLQDNSVAWKLNGSFNDEKLTGGAKTGSLMTLQKRGVPYPVEAELKVGETTITAKGTLTDPARPSALDVNLKILGASMADLFPLGGVLLPETPKFSTEGRLHGTLGRGNMRLSYEKFQGRVGSSDLSGTLEYLQRKPRPILRGDVASNYLNLKDLSRLVGAGGPKKQKSDEVKQPADKVLPVSPFKTERWGKMDVDVRFTGKEIVRSESLPIDHLHTEIKMNNGVLSLAPLNFGVAGGRLTAELMIDGRNTPAKAKMKVSARGLKLKEMFPKVEEMRASLGQLHGEAQITAAGNSFAALMAASNGEVKALISEGTVSKFIMEAIGLNIASAVAAKIFGDKQVQLNCMATDLKLTNGIMEPSFFVVDTTDATIKIDGNINFKTEKLNLTIHPDSKGVRIISLRSPLYIGGTFKKPDVGINKGIVALKAGAAATLGVVATPLAALLALINPGPGENSPCAQLLAQADKKPSAPAPGKIRAETEGRKNK